MNITLILFTVDWKRKKKRYNVNFSKRVFSPGFHIATYYITMVIKRWQVKELYMIISRRYTGCTSNEVDKCLSMAISE